VDILDRIVQLIETLDVLIALATGAGAATVVLRIARRRRHRGFWRLRSPIQMSLCVATSAATNTGKYTRYATGVGQVRALSDITHSLKQAYGEDADPTVYMSESMPAEAVRCDLVLVGGSKNNTVTRRFLDAVFDDVGLRFDPDDENIIVLDGVRYETLVSNGAVQKDYALVLVTDNPFCNGRRVFLFAGSHTYGTGAAGRLLREDLIEERFFLPRRFLCLAEITVDQHLDLTMKTVLFRPLKPGTHA
jgi:hypothetical protein